MKTTGIEFTHTFLCKKDLHLIDNSAKDITFLQGKFYSSSKKFVSENNLGKEFNHLIVMIDENENTHFFREPVENLPNNSFETFFNDYFYTIEEFRNLQLQKLI